MAYFQMSSVKIHLIKTMLGYPDHHHLLSDRVFLYIVAIHDHFQFYNNVSCVLMFYRHKWVVVVVVVFFCFSLYNNKL